MEITTRIIIIFKELICIINILLLVYSIKKFPVNKKFLVNFLLMFIFFFSFGHLFLNYFSYYNFLIISLVLQFLIYLYIVKLSFFSKIILFFLALFIESFVEILIEQFITIFITHISPMSLMSLSNKIIEFILFAIYLIFLVYAKNNKKNNTECTYLYLYLCIAFFTGLILLLVVSFYGHRLTVLMNVFLIGCSLALVTSNLTIIYFYSKEKKENIIMINEIIVKDEMFKLQEQYFENITNYYSEIRAFRHDIKGYITTIKQLISSKSYDNLENLMNSMNSNIKKNEIIMCNNAYIGAILNHFHQTCKRKKIDFIIEYQVLNTVKMQPDHICSLFYNLLVNAVESANQSSMKYIFISIKNKDRALAVKLINGVSEHFDINCLKNKISSKKYSHAHGFGTKNIDFVIKQYNGDYTISLSEQLLESSIVLLNAIETFK